MSNLLWKKAVDFHGHACGGLAIGVRVSMVVKEHFGCVASPDEQLVCVTENDACGVDGIQAILGCTVGKGNLIFRLRGKQAFTFFVRETGEGVRIMLKPLQRQMSQGQRIDYFLNAPTDELFTLSQPQFSMPERARLFKSVICSACGEAVAEPFVRLQQGEMACLDCFSEYDREALK